MSDYYDREGQRITGTSPEDVTLRWAGLFEDMGYRQVLHTALPDGTEVSTIWLGLDHGWPFATAPGEKYRPLIFETMLFRPMLPEEIAENQTSEFRIIRENRREEVEQRRYSTEAEAIAGHWEIVDAWVKDLSDADRKRFQASDPRAIPDRACPADRADQG